MCCGHVFCKSCIDNTKQNTAIVKACPVCRNEEFTTVLISKLIDWLEACTYFVQTKKKVASGKANSMTLKITFIVVMAASMKIFCAQMSVGK